MADYTPNESIADMSPEASEMLALMSQKRTILNSPGTKLSSLYYSVNNSTTDSVEITYNTGRYTSSLSTPLFGAQSQVIIANSSFVGDTYLHLELPNIYENQTLTRGWGYGIIASLSYLFGSSSVSQTQINGQTMLHKVMMAAETAERRSALLALGGDEMLSPIMRLNPSTNVAERDPDAIISADILLPFPWSSSSGLFCKKPFDTNILSNPITIQIQFASVNQIFGGTPTPTTPFPTGFSTAQVLFRMGDLYSKNVSLKRALDLNPDKSIFYPEVFTQSYTPSVFRGSRNINNRVSVPLLGFINADLLAITIGVVRTDLLSPPAGQSPNVFHYDTLQNIQLIYNGTIMFQAPRTSWKLFTMKSIPGAQYFHNSFIQPTLTGLAPFQSIPQDTYLLHIDFSAIRAVTYEGQMQNVWRIGNNTLTLNFNTSGDETVRYQMFCTYHYNGVVQCMQGQTALYF